MPIVAPPYSIGVLLALLVVVVSVVGLILILLGQGLEIPVWVLLLLIGTLGLARLT